MVEPKNNFNKVNLYQNNLLIGLEITVKLSEQNQPPVTESASTGAVVVLFWELILEVWAKYFSLGVEVPCL